MESTFLCRSIELCPYVGILVSYISETEFLENFDKLSNNSKLLQLFFFYFSWNRIDFTVRKNLFFAHAIDGKRNRKLMEEGTETLCTGNCRRKKVNMQLMEGKETDFWVKAIDEEVGNCVLSFMSCIDHTTCCVVETMSKFW